MGSPSSFAVTRFALLLCCCVLIAWGCATPVRPSGGPVDRTPPALVESQPEAGAVNVNADRIILHFSERLDENSVSGAVSIAPQFSTPPSIQGRGNRIEVVFPDSLRAETTYIITIGTGLRDEHGVALTAPLTVAFSSGDKLDEGEISGQLVHPETRAGSGGMHIFAYYLEDENAVLPDPRTELPSYQTETGTDGTFRLRYLREGAYFVIGLQDRNRNQLADDGERFAVSRSAIQHASASSDSTSSDARQKLTMYTTSRDSTAPQLRSIRPLSNQRFVLTFDEPLAPFYLGASPATFVADGTRTSAETVYQLPSDSTRLYLTSPAPVEADSVDIELKERLVSDVAGNSIEAISRRFGILASVDTLRIRFQGFLPTHGSPADSVLLLRSNEQPGLQFNQAINPWPDNIQFRGPEGIFEPVSRTSNHTSYELSEFPNSFTVTVAEADTTHTRRYAYPTQDALGAIKGTVSANTDNRVWVRAYPETGSFYEVRIGDDGAFLFPSLEPGTYRIRVHEEGSVGVNWFGGQLAPYQPPGVLFWLDEPIVVRARWEHEIEEIIDLTEN